MTASPLIVTTLRGKILSKFAKCPILKPARWFQIRRSSPLTGLVLDNTDFRFNGQIANEVKHWIEGVDIVQSSPSADSSVSHIRTRRFSLSSRPNQELTVRFFSRLGSFSRRIPKTLSVNNLYKLAFRGMKGRHAKFELYSKNVFLVPSETPVSSTNVRNDSIIHINVQEAPSVTSTNRDTQEPENTDFEELCLIKVYERYDHVLFSYWTPKSTTKTLASIVFRYWRHLFKSSAWIIPRDAVVWTGLHDEGDRHIIGHSQDHWQQLSKFLDPVHATGKLKDEEAYDKESPDASEDTGEEDLEIKKPSPLVLKILVSTKPKKPKKRSGKNLSRVRHCFRHVSFRC